jgi:hypothetical protein
MRKDAARTLAMVRKDLATRLSAAKDGTDT